MLKITQKIMDKNKIKNKRVLTSMTMWEKSNTSLGGYSMNVDELREQLKNRYIHIQCEKNEYIDLEKINGEWIQISSSVDNNKSEGKFHLITQKANDLYIDLSFGLIDMINIDIIKKDYIIKIVNKNQNKVIYYGLVVRIEIKETYDEKRNKIYTLDVVVYLHELKTINLLMNTISIAFLSMLIYFLINLVKKEFNLMLIDYAFIVVFITYFGQLILRTKYVKNTLLNKFYWWFKRFFKKTKHDPFRFNLKEFNKRVSKAHKKYNKTNGELGG